MKKLLACLLLLATPLVAQRPPDEALWETRATNWPHAQSFQLVAGNASWFEFAVGRDIRISAVRLGTWQASWLSTSVPPRVWLTSGREQHLDVLADLVPPANWDSRHNTHVWNEYTVPGRLQLRAGATVVVHVEARSESYFNYSRNDGWTPPPAPTQNGLTFTLGSVQSRYDTFTFQPGFVRGSEFAFPNMSIIGGNHFEDPNEPKPGCGRACRFLTFSARLQDNPYNPGHNGRSETIYVTFDEPLADSVSDSDVESAVELSCGRVTDVTEIPFGILDSYWVTVKPCREDLRFGMRRNLDIQDKFGRTFGGAPAITVRFTRR